MWLSAICSLVLVACASATDPVYDKIPDDIVEEGLVSIAYLKSLCKGRSTVIDKDISISGTVVANDLFGEFYKTVVIVDTSGGIEISVDKIRLYENFPLYSEVAVICNGLALGRVGGKITLGAVPTGEYATDRIPYSEIERYFVSGSVAADSEPVVLSIPELSVEHVSLLVMIDDLCIVDEERGASWCDCVDGVYVDTERRVRDADGNILLLKMYGECSYAHETVPEGRMSLAGIIDYAYGEYFMRIANHYIFSDELR